MSIEKIFYKELFKNLFSDTCEVKYWDGEVEKYGEGESKFKIILNESIPKADVIKDPSLTLGEAFMSKKIDIEGNIESVIESIYNNSESFLRKSEKYKKFMKNVSNTIKKSKENVQHHYDIGNDFYKLWLDDTMTYSCAYFKSLNDTLTTAQKNKVQHILKKLSLNPGQTLLDIGCGWGELIIAAAKQYKVKALGITLSNEQFSKVKERIKDEHLENLVEVELMDYREIKNRKFDRIVSVGMAEHLGKDHIAEYFSKVYDMLNDKGVSLLHCITGVQSGGTNSWLNEYIFPGGYVPAVKELIDNMSEFKFYLVDVESLRRHYAYTLEHWRDNFETNLSEISKTKDETFIRMWRLYLNACAASFKCGNIDVHQFLFTKGINDSLPWTRDYMYKS